MQIYDVNGNVYDGYSFSGKSIITFGDGITSEDGKTYAGETVKGYQGYLRDAGFTVTNAGISNACITYHAGDPTDICETVHDTNCTEYDYVMIAGGVNDFRLASSPMGELADSDYDSGTFIGSLQYMIEKIVADKPDIKLFFVTPLLCDGWNTPNALDYTLTDYSDAIKYVAARYAIPVLDFTSVSGLNDKNISVLTRDGLHPKNIGYQLFSRKLLSFVDSLNTGSDNTEKGSAVAEEVNELNQKIEQLKLIMSSITPNYEDTAVATRSYVNNDILSVGTSLRKAKSVIAIGDTISDSNTTSITLIDYIQNFHKLPSELTIASLSIGSESWTSLPAAYVSDGVYETSVTYTYNDEHLPTVSLSKSNAASEWHYPKNGSNLFQATTYKVSNGIRLPTIHQGAASGAYTNTENGFNFSSADPDAADGRFETYLTYGGAVNRIIIQLKKST